MAYNRTFHDIEAKVQDLLAAVKDTGGTATPAQLARLTQWSILLQGLQDANKQLVKEVGGSVAKMQRNALLQANTDTQTLIADTIAKAGGFVPFIQPIPLVLQRENGCARVAVGS